MPEGIVPTESDAHRVREILHASARRQDVVTLRRLCSIPLASVLRDDVVKKSAEELALRDGRRP